jgi:hypothetical protein
VAESLTVVSTDTRDREQQHPQDDDELLRVARQRFAQAEAAERDERVQQAEASRFRSGDQWTAEMRATRQQPGSTRPCLVIPRQEQFIRQVTNEERKNPQAIRVNPVDSGADVPTAELLQGLIRHIEVASRADIAMALAYDQAVGQGLGYVRLLTRYVDARSFDQEVLIQPVRSRMAVYFDPHSESPDGLDADWGFVVERMSKAAFAATYPQARASMAGWGEEHPWYEADSVQVAEYWYKEYTTRTLVQLATGEVMLREQNVRQIPVVAMRQVQDVTVWQVKMSGYMVLSRTQWLGRYIPIIPVVGNLLIVDDMLRKTGMVQPSMDAQKRYNYLVSSETEAIALMPRAPFIGYKDVFEGLEDFWQTANTAAHAYLPANRVDTTAGPLPLPQRLAVEPAVQAMTQARLMAADDIKATLGMYAEGQDPRMVEQSGVAIEKRRQTGQTANYQYPANLAWARRAMGIQLLDLIPKIYDTAQVLRIIGEDGAVRQVQVAQHAGLQQLLRQGVGRYDVTVSSGPAYETQRQEAAAGMDRLMTAYPPAAPVIADLFVQSLDVPMAKDMAARLKTLVPPEALAATNAETPADQVAQAQNMVRQLQQDMQALQAYAQDVEQKLQAAGDELKLMRLTNADLVVKLDNKQGELSLKGRELDLDQQSALWKHEEALLSLQIDAAKAAESAAAPQPTQAAKNGTGRYPDGSVPAS